MAVYSAMKLGSRRSACTACATQASVLASYGADASTIMCCTGWASPESLNGYVKVDEDCKRRSFLEATGKAEARGSHDQKEIMTPDEFLRSSGA